MSKLRGLKKTGKFDTGETKSHNSYIIYSPIMALGETLQVVLYSL